VLVSCSGGKPAPEKGASATGPVRGGTLIASLRSEPATFNRFAPTAAQAAVDAVARLTQATLVRLNRVSGEPEPWLAEKWTVSPDGRTITLTLRSANAEYTVRLKEPIEEQDDFVWLPYEVLDRRTAEAAVPAAAPSGAIPLQFPKGDALPGESPSDWLIPHVGNRAENAA